MTHFMFSLGQSGYWHHIVADDFDAAVETCFQRFPDAGQTEVWEGTPGDAAVIPNHPRATKRTIDVRAHAERLILARETAQAGAKKPLLSLRRKPKTL